MYLDRDMEVKEGSSLGYFTNFEIIVLLFESNISRTCFSQNVIPVVGASKVKKVKDSLIILR